MANRQNRENINMHQKKRHWQSEIEEGIVHEKSSAVAFINAWWPQQLKKPPNGKSEEDRRNGKWP